MLYPDGTGRVMLHPLLPHPADLTGYSADWDPVFIGIDTLERSNEAQLIIDSMKK